ncbi:hypothetical protein SEA_DANZINA_22 [Streptomyces phage Danzina]|uniref:Uncharacterized protein n=3 Tax=Likavirus TaxID=1982880 RepID=A0A1C9LWG6_9CAUD|nr:hypothetical protein FDG70_gp22 [Streptomyces phage Danzina]YP_010056650.1 hypothetical protein KGH01_gp21 [Streptomyces phage Lorelei]AOQ27072.1 hypothetical protein SEA_BRATAYLOR_22 [Streptomyces phage Brataylor]AWN07239.1 hypothetical protein SEA_RANA_21 [Streptomyces phage Rana]AWN07315.1 hypothetical protein SEA_NABI_21 [Streptomyces phage Nabi]AKY03477.1 hypothetical protein SEA_DANZINA_22 [Streptomyces phage Danzina]AOQ26920.1 hypothetical protein SEA_LORELEI_21 [Streptomyces phage 
MATPKVFFRGELPAARTVAYTVPAGKSAAVTSIVATNPGTDTSMISMWIDGVPVLAAVGLHVNGVLTLEISQALNEGDTIEVQGNSVPAQTHISGVEF